MPDSTHEDNTSRWRAELDPPRTAFDVRTPPPGHGTRETQIDDGVTTMAEKRTDRRGLFMAAGATALGAAVVGLADTTPAGAADGDPILLGKTNSANDVTSITSAGGFASENTADLNAGVYGNDVSSKNGYGVYGQSENGISVYGSPFGNTSGLLGSSIGAVVGDSAGSIGVLGLSSSNDGVHGETTHNENSGIAGIDTSTNGGHGAYGRSTNGIGVFGTLASGLSGLLGTSVAGVVGDSSPRPRRTRTVGRQRRRPWHDLGRWFQRGAGHRPEHRGRLRRLRKFDGGCGSQG